MKVIEFTDRGGQTIRVQHGSSGYRIYIVKDAEGNDASGSIFLTDNQTQILISALQDLLDDE